jgi:hypothetical protein
MGRNVPETCWDIDKTGNKKYCNVTSCWYLFITRYNAIFTIFPINYISVQQKACNLPLLRANSLPLRMWCNKFFISKGDRFIRCSDASSPVQINVRDSSVAITYNTETTQHKQPRLVPTYVKSSGGGNIFWPKFQNVLMLPLCHMLVRASSFLDGIAPMKNVGTQSICKMLYLFYYVHLSATETGSNKQERWQQ